VRKKFPPFLGPEVFGDQGNDIVLFVIEVLIDDRREPRDLGHEFLGTPPVTRLGPRDCRGPNSLDGIVDCAVRIFHPGPLLSPAGRTRGQPWPQNLVLGGMMKVHRRQHEVDVLADNSGASRVTGRDTADEASSVTQLPSETAVDQRHLERITWHLYPRCRMPEVIVGSVDNRLGCIAKLGAFDSHPIDSAVASSRWGRSLYRIFIERLAEP
jgi:hypothetical protein